VSAYLESLSMVPHPPGPGLGCGPLGVSCNTAAARSAVLQALFPNTDVFGGTRR
jgi:hypothetical protein